MKKKLFKFTGIAFLAFLPFPFIFEWSLIFGSIYILAAIMICGAAWGQLNRGADNAN